jgi:hypothetical protein
MRVDSEAQRVERGYGIGIVERSQSETRITIYSEKLHAFLVEQRIQHPGPPTCTGASPTRWPSPHAGGGWRNGEVRAD